MNPADLLLNEKFVEFSSQIAALYEKKKELQVEVRRIVEEHKAAIKELDDQALTLKGEFEAWQGEQTSK